MRNSRQRVQHGSSKMPRVRRTSQLDCLDVSSLRR
jgi:hypothetical protein